MPWAHGVNMILGLWLISSPFSLGYADARLKWSDVVCGVLAIVLSYLTVLTRREWLSWLTALVGLWLIGAPLIFFAPTAAAYNTDTLIGTLIIVLAVMVPGAIGVREGRGDELPPGWNYNPSAWSQRAPIVGLAMLGFFLARYMAAYQLGHLSSIWEPFFGRGTERVLTSKVAEAFPVSDAGLGAASYLLDALAGALGGRRRWRTMPWIVIIFGLFIIPPGATGIVLIMLQPISVGSWCTVCLIASVVMLLMVPSAVDEVVASVQFLQRRHRAGDGFWKTFWHGAPDAEEDVATQTAPDGEYSPRGMLDALEIFAMPWNLWLSTLLGGALMFAPALLNIGGAAANNHYIVGALAVTFSIIAAAEAARMVRWLNLPLGAWLLLAPWILGGTPSAATWLTILAGALLIGCAVPRGVVTNRFDGWDRFVV